MATGGAHCSTWLQSTPYSYQCEMRQIEDVVAAKAYVNVALTLAANSESIPVPQPISNTVFPLNMWLLFTMEFM